MSMIFLQRRIKIREWFGIVFVIAGLAVVGASDIIFPSSSEDAKSTSNIIIGKIAFLIEIIQKNNILISLGDCLIIGAQILTASQFVFEEKYVTRQNIPALQAVGWEGLHNISILINNSIKLIIFEFFIGIFGFVTMGLLLIPFFFIIVPSPFGSPYSHRLEDVPDAFLQMGNNNLIIVGIVGKLNISFSNLP